MTGAWYLFPRAKYGFAEWIDVYGGGSPYACISAWRSHVMTIVCATHFTTSSANAVTVAALLARQSSERLWLTSVVPNR